MRALGQKNIVLFLAARRILHAMWHISHKLDQKVKLPAFNND